MEIFLKHLHIPGGHNVQGGTFGIFPQALQGAGHNTGRCFLHFPAEYTVTIFDYLIGIATILLDQSQTGVTVEKVFFKGIITKKLYQQFTNTATMADNDNFAFVIDFMELPKHQIFFTDHPEFDDFIQFTQGIDDPGVFLVGFVIIVAFHNSELGNGLSIDVVGKKTEPSGRSHKFILVLACRLTDHPQPLSTMLNSDVVIGSEPLLNNRCTVSGDIRKLFAIDCKEKTQSIFVNIHRDIDNIIEVDFLGSLRNLHNGFSFWVDSIGCEIQPSHCTSAFEGEAFLLAA
jgi:hypothetical protein